MKHFPKFSKSPNFSSTSVLSTGIKFIPNLGSSETLIPPQIRARLFALLLLILVVVFYWQLPPLQVMASEDQSSSEIYDLAPDLLPPGAATDPIYVNPENVYYAPNPTPNPISPDTLANQPLIADSETEATTTDSAFDGVRTKPINAASATFGMPVVILEGTVYYASADPNNPGPSGIFSQDNPFTVGLTGYIGGFARLDANQNLAAAECYLRDQLPLGAPSPEFCQDPLDEDEIIMYHIFVDGFTTGSLGWVASGNIGQEQTSPPCSISPATLPPSPQPDDSDADPKPDYAYPSIESRPVLPKPKITPGADVTLPELADDIEGYAQSAEKIALLLDASSSVADYAPEIAQYAAQLNQAEEVIIFADRPKTIDATEYDNQRDSVGSETDIYAALNSVPDDQGIQTVMLVTDTQHNIIFSRLKSRTDIEQVVIVSTVPEDYVNRRVIRNIKSNWGVTPVIQYLYD